MTDAQRKIIVVGGTMAGLMVALKAVESGVEVLLVSPVPIRHSIPLMGWDGVFGIDTGTGSAGALKSAVDATLMAGCGLVEESVVSSHFAKSPAILSFLERIGVPFDRDAEGWIRTYPARPDGVHLWRAGTDTGRHIHAGLVAQAQRESAAGRLELRQHHDPLSLVLDGKGICRGLTVQDLRSMSVETIKGDAVILCQDGAVALFDSLAVHLTYSGGFMTRVYRQGAAIANPEFVALHLAIRGADESSDGNAAVAPTIPTILGGLAVDASGATTIHGVYSAGESACLPHGADILPGNQWLFCLSSGMIAGQGAAEYVTRLAHGCHQVDEAHFIRALQSDEENWRAVIDLSGPENTGRLHDDLAELMRDNFMTARDEAGLKSALLALKNLRERHYKIGVPDKGSWCNRPGVSVRHLDLLLEAAQLMAYAALLRQESRGRHFRSDRPAADDARYLKRTIARHTAEGSRISHLVVGDTPIENDPAVSMVVRVRGGRKSEQELLDTDAPGMA